MIGLDARLADKLLRILFLAERQFSIKATITSGARSRDTQQGLYDRYRQGRGPKAAAPGRSCHEVGAAADVVVAQAGNRSREAAKAILVDLFRQNGLQIELYGDSWHIHVQDSQLCRQLRGEVVPARPQLQDRESSRRQNAPADPSGTGPCP